MIGWVKKTYRRLTLLRWDIVVLDNSIEDVVHRRKLRGRIVKSQYTDRWFADPFVLDVEDRYVRILAEEYCFCSRKGRIVRLTIDRETMLVLKRDEVLELPSHLSYPAIVRKNGRVYVYPENANAGCLNVYEYDSQSNEISGKRKVCGIPLTDATYTDLFGESLVFSTKRPFPRCNGKVLEVYRIENGVLVPLTKMKFGRNCARMGGDFFRFQDEVYRPAQNCDRNYGRFLSLQRVRRTEDGFECSEVRKIFSPLSWLDVGCHTLNANNGVVVMDVCRFHRSPLLANALFFMRHPILCMKDLFERVLFK